MIFYKGSLKLCRKLCKTSESEIETKLTEQNQNKMPYLNPTTTTQWQVEQEQDSPRTTANDYVSYLGKLGNPLPFAGRRSAHLLILLIEGSSATERPFEGPFHEPFQKVAGFIHHSHGSLPKLKSLTLRRPINS